MAPGLSDVETGAIAAPEWRVSSGLTPYPEALAEMEARNQAIERGEAADR